MTKALKTIKMIGMINNIENEKFYSPEDLAETFQVSLSSIYKLIHNGNLPHIRLGKVYRIPASDLKSYLVKRGHHLKTTNPRELKEIPVLNGFFKEIEKSPLKKTIREIWLFGSYARGDYQVDSDVDLLVVLKERSLRMSQQLSELSEKAMEAVDYEDLLSLMELSEEEWNSMKKNKYLLAQTIAGEGILLWKHP